MHIWDDPFQVQGLQFQGMSTQRHEDLEEVAFQGLQGPTSVSGGIRFHWLQVLTALGRAVGRGKAAQIVRDLGIPEPRSR